MTSKKARKTKQNADDPKKNAPSVDRESPNDKPRADTARQDRQNMEQQFFFLGGTDVEGRYDSPLRATSFPQGGPLAFPTPGS